MKKLIILLFILLSACRAEPNSIKPSPRTNTSYIHPLLVSAGSPAYGIVIFPHQKLVFIPNVNIPDAWSVISPQTGSMYVAGDFLGNDYSKMYVISYTFNDLREVNMTTGEVNIIGKVELAQYGGWTGMAISESGKAYLTSTDTISTILYTVDLKTGKTTPLGEIVGAPCLIDIAITHTNIMYGLNMCADTLVKINPHTLRGETLGSIGFDANYSQDMDYDEATQQLYLASFNRTTFQGELRLADVKTGNTTLIGAFQNGDEIDAFSFATARNVKSYYLPVVIKAQ